MAITKPEDTTKGLKDIFGVRSAITANGEDNDIKAGQQVLPPAEGNAEQQSLDSVLASLTSTNLPSVRQMFDQVASLFTRKPATTT
jgi:hypothetical protein